jgi:arabinose-5-phosphate isomerase
MIHKRCHYFHQRFNHGITVVTNEDEIIGVITDGDLRRMLMKGDDIAKVLAKDIMSAHPRPLKEALWQKKP